jgi:hypothetical protein
MKLKKDKDKSHEKSRKKIQVKSARVNSTNPPFMTWDRDLKNLDFQKNNTTKQSEVK